MKFLRILLIVVVLTVVAVATGGFYFFSQLQPVTSTAAEPQEFVIPKGQAASVVAQRLQEEGLIRNALAFRLMAKMDGFESEIQSGSFMIAPSMSISQIGQILTVGADDVWITLLEGWRVEEIAESLAEQELPLFDADEFIALAKSDEGKMFPDSYLIPRDYTAEQVHSLLLTTFETKVEEDLADDIAASEHEFADALVMASIIEREARGLEEMKHVSGILWNRIELGMPLQADATLQYVAGYNEKEKDWWSPPDVTVKETDSPYNTYKNPGLPPRPIANPGLDAIRAALTPRETDNIFYLHGRDGTIYYGKTLDEHNANIDRYLR